MAEDIQTYANLDNLLPPEPSRCAEKAAETSTVKGAFGGFPLDGAQSERHTAQSGTVEADSRRSASAGESCGRVAGDISGGLLKAFGGFIGSVAGHLLSEFDNNTVVDDAVDGSGGGHGVFEDLILLGKDQVGSAFYLAG